MLCCLNRKYNFIKEQVTTYKYISSSTFLCSLQCGFRLGHTTATDMLKITDIRQSSYFNTSTVIVGTFGFQILLIVRRSFNTYRYDKSPSRENIVLGISFIAA